MRTSKTTKNAYLEKLTEKIKMNSVDVGKDLDGSTPPSVFIGRWSYPKVYAGPMMVPQLGDTYIMDSPEQWIANNKSQEDIITYRMNLVRGKQLIDIKDLENPFVEKLQDISLASKSIDSEEWYMFLLDSSEDDFYLFEYIPLYQYYLLLLELIK